MNGTSLTRGLTVGLAAVYFSVNVVFAHAPEAGFWSERRRALERGGKGQLAEARFPLAGLPSIASGGEGLSAAISKQLPNELASAGGPEQPARRFASAYGAVRGLALPPAGTPARGTVVHVQDVHLNAEAQKNVSLALRDFAERGLADLVALEGAFSPLDVERFRAYPRPDMVGAVADFLLKENRISGGAHAALVGRVAPAPFVGVDDAAHHAANVEAYRRSLPRADEARAAFARLAEELARRKAAVYSAELADLDQRAEAYAAGRAPLSAHVSFLVAGPGTSFPALLAFDKAMGMEKSMDFSRAERERGEVLERLARSLDQSRLEELVRRGVDYRLGRLGHADFYRGLRGLCREAGVDLARRPALDHYLRYVLAADAVDPQALFQEVRGAERAAFAALARTPEQRRLAAASRRLGLARKLLNFSLSPEEWEEYAAGSALFPDPAPLGPFEDFYKSAQARDRAMAANLLAAMDRQGAKTAALVAGGFHSRGLTRLLNAAGVTVVSFVPRVTRLDGADGAAALGVFAREKTPLEKLFAGERLFLSMAPMDPAAFRRAAAAGVFYEEAGDPRPLPRERREAALALAGPGANINVASRDAGPGRAEGEVRAENGVVLVEMAASAGEILFFGARKPSIPPAAPLLAAAAALTLAILSVLAQAHGLENTVEVAAAGLVLDWRRVNDVARRLLPRLDPLRGVLSEILTALQSQQGRQLSDKKKDAFARCLAESWGGAERALREQIPDAIVNTLLFYGRISAQRMIRHLEGEATAVPKNWITQSLRRLDLLGEQGKTAQTASVDVGGQAREIINLAAMAMDELRPQAETLVKGIRAEEASLDNLRPCARFFMGRPDNEYPILVNLLAAEIIQQDLKGKELGFLTALDLKSADAATAYLARLGREVSYAYQRWINEAALLQKPGFNLRKRDNQETMTAFLKERIATAQGEPAYGGDVGLLLEDEVLARRRPGGPGLGGAVVALLIVAATAVDLCFTGESGQAVRTLAAGSVAGWLALVQAAKALHDKYFLLRGPPIDPANNMDLWREWADKATERLSNATRDEMLDLPGLEMLARSVRRRVHDGLAFYLEQLTTSWRLADETTRQRAEGDILRLMEHWNSLRKLPEPLYLPATEPTLDLGNMAMQPVVERLIQTVTSPESTPGDVQDMIRRLHQNASDIVRILFAERFLRADNSDLQETFFEQIDRRLRNNKKSRDDFLGLRHYLDGQQMSWTGEVVSGLQLCTGMGIENFPATQDVRDFVVFALARLRLEPGGFGQVDRFFRALRTPGTQAFAWLNTHREAYTILHEGLDFADGMHVEGAAAGGEDGQRAWAVRESAQGILAVAVDRRAGPGAADAVEIADRFHESLGIGAGLRRAKSAARAALSGLSASARLVFIPHRGPALLDASVGSAPPALLMRNGPADERRDGEMEVRYMKYRVPLRLTLASPGVDQQALRASTGWEERAGTVVRESLRRNIIDGEAAPGVAAVVKIEKFVEDPTLALGDQQLEALLVRIFRLIFLAAAAAAALAWDPGAGASLAVGVLALDLDRLKGPVRNLAWVVDGLRHGLRGRPRSVLAPKARERADTASRALFGFIDTFQGESLENRVLVNTLMHHAEEDLKLIHEGRAEDLPLAQVLFWDLLENRLNFPKSWEEDVVLTLDRRGKPILDLGAMAARRKIKEIINRVLSPRRRPAALRDRVRWLRDRHEPTDRVLLDAFVEFFIAHPNEKAETFFENLCSEWRKAAPSDPAHYLFALRDAVARRRREWLALSSNPDILLDAAAQVRLTPAADGDVVETMKKDSGLLGFAPWALVSQVLGFDHYEIVENNRKITVFARWRGEEGESGMWGDRVQSCGTFFRQNFTPVEENLKDSGRRTMPAPQTQDRKPVEFPGWLDILSRQVRQRKVSAAAAAAAVALDDLNAAALLREAGDPPTPVLRRKRQEDRPIRTSPLQTALTRTCLFLEGVKAYDPSIIDSLQEKLAQAENLKELVAQAAALRADAAARAAEQQRGLLWRGMFKADAGDVVIVGDRLSTVPALINKGEFFELNRRTVEATDLSLERIQKILAEGAPPSGGTPSGPTAGFLVALAWRTVPLLAIAWAVSAAAAPGPGVHLADVLPAVLPQSMDELGGGLSAQAAGMADAALRDELDRLAGQGLSTDERAERLTQAVLRSLTGRPADAGDRTGRVVVVGQDERDVAGYLGAALLGIGRGRALVIDATGRDGKVADALRRLDPRRAAACEVRRAAEVAGVTGGRVALGEMEKSLARWLEDLTALDALVTPADTDVDASGLREGSLFRGAPWFKGVARLLELWERARRLAAASA